MTIPLHLVPTALHVFMVWCLGTGISLSYRTFGKIRQEAVSELLNLVGGGVRNLGVDKPFGSRPAL
jgi:hypothetical protein